VRWLANQEPLKPDKWATPVVILVREDVATSIRRADQEHRRSIAAAARGVIYQRMTDYQAIGVAGDFAIELDEEVLKRQPIAGSDQATEAPARAAGQP
jgi:hypothetical protein